MDQKSRLSAAFDLQLPDRPPILGGWLAEPAHVQALAGCSDDAYWEDPVYWCIEAERVLGSDGMVGYHVPVVRGGYRVVDEQVLAERAAYDMERVLAEIAALPEPEQARADFDEEAAYAALRAELLEMQARCGDIVWCPADWRIIPHALEVHKYGYENALMLPLLHPAAHRKMMQVGAEHGRQKSALRARAMREGLQPRAILTGEDLCGQRGPLISPAFLHREYFPLVEYALEPLLSAGAQVVWHCDGNARPLLHDVLACGLAGLQGFQTECGLDLEWIVKMETRGGKPLLIFGPLSVTTTLVRGAPDDVRAEVRRAMRLCRDKAALVFLTSNSILPDVPLENVRAFWDEVLGSHW